jgi:hypothetical protein
MAFIRTHGWILEGVRFYNSYCFEQLGAIVQDHEFCSLLVLYLIAQAEDHEPITLGLLYSILNLKRKPLSSSICSQSPYTARIF